ncbi:hypothetical protein ACH5Y9_06230 [Methylomonas sp. BW4-1]|uniref:hypothetical protein n=1 Tax=Methylomonas sp. BW4-1 TaxID=3376685 RepID=UPI0040430F2F
MMNKAFTLKTLGGLFLVGTAALATNAEAATVDFQGMTAATYGNANETTGAFIGGCPDSNCFAQNGIVVGTVGDPTDSGAHYHRQGTSGDREAQYHPDSTGLYVRMADLSNFSLQNIYLNVTNGEAGGNFVLYGYSNAINNGLPTVAGGTSGGAGSSSDPEGGNTAPIASYVVANDGTFDQNVTLSDLLAADSDWGDIGAFWLTFQGFNHSPTVNYALGSYPDWDIRIDDITLDAPVSSVPVPGAVWLFGSALLGMIAQGRRKAMI